jgi:hypothetical protein
VGENVKRKILKWTLVVIGVIFVGLQFTGPARTNPPFDESATLEATTALPPLVANFRPLLQRLP